MKAPLSGRGATRGPEPSFRAPRGRSGWVLLLAVAILLGTAAPVRAFKFLRTGGTNKPIRWKTLPVKYLIHVSGSDDVSDGSDFKAVKEAFAVWESPSCTALRFEYAGLSAEKGYDKKDGKTVVAWEEQSWPHGKLVLAVSVNHFDPVSGEMSDAEALMNGVDFKWTGTGEAGRADIQRILSQRVGMMVGLWYTDVAGSVMHHMTTKNPFQRMQSLGPDDIAGICTLYPAASWDGRVPEPVGSPDIQTPVEPAVEQPVVKEWGGQPDGGEVGDGGGGGGADGEVASGCSCSYNPVGAPSFGLTLLVLLLALGRRSMVARRGSEE